MCSQQGLDVPSSGGQLGLAVLFRIGSEDAQEFRSPSDGAGAEQIRGQRENQPGLPMGLEKNPVPLAEFLPLTERSQVIEEANGSHRSSEMVVFRRPQQTDASDLSGEAFVKGLVEQPDVIVRKIAGIGKLLVEELFSNVIIRERRREST